MPKECGSEFAAYGLPTQDLPDPVARAIEGLLDQISRLQARITVLESEVETTARPRPAMAWLKRKQGTRPKRRGSPVRSELTLVEAQAIAS